LEVSAFSAIRDVANKSDSQFTLLFQDEHGGLQFLDRASKEFIDAVPQPGVLYMNIGDMFQRVSNGKFISILKCPTNLS
jgi:isopenicillin N synthase-like dioxygenase